MNTIRDSIPVETLLRQYIDESTEYEVKPKEVPVEKQETKPVETKPVLPVEMKPVEMKPIEMKPIELKPIEMKPMEVTPVPIEMSDSKQNISFNDQLETFEIPVEEDSLQIGEDIPLNMLSFEDLEKSEPCDIDLGIVEL
jgi:hypothetical protein